MTDVCKVRYIGDPICGRPATLMGGNAATCDCPVIKETTKVCDEHIAWLLEPGWNCSACGAPSSHTEPVRL